VEREPLKKIINSIKGYLMKKIQSVKVKQLGGDWLESQPKKYRWRLQ
jgi:ribosomal protein S17E